MMRFRVGNLEVTCVSDGILNSSIDFILGMEREGGNPDIGSRSRWYAAHFSQ